MYLAFLAFFSLILSQTAIANAACGQGKLAKHQLVVVLIGDNKLGAVQEAFGSQLETVVDKYGSKAEKQWLALGGSLDKETNVFSPMTKPSRGTQNARFVEASGEGLQKISKEINAEYEELRRQDPKLTPDDVQVLFYVSNHGTMTTGKDGKKFGVAASPNSKVTNPAHGNTPQIDEDDLYQFGKSLPAGIRTKAVFSQCYSANTLESYLKGLQSNNGCGCGAASSDLNEVAYSTYWEQEIVENSPGNSFSKAVSITRFKDTTNMSSTSSESLVYRSLLAKQKELGISAAGANDLLLQSQAILAKAQASKKELSQEERDILETVIRGNAAGYYEWMQNMDSATTKKSLTYSSASAEEKNKMYAASKDPLVKDLVKFINPTAIGQLEKDSSREQLVKSFLLTATPEEKKAYRDLVRCEQDPLDTRSSVSPNGGTSPGDTEEQSGFR
jgi:hypothetical protein